MMSAPTVIVVGAGVSGCACAAVLAETGVRVTLLNSAMDRVGLPAYGPDLVDSGTGTDPETVLRQLPEPLRHAWLQASARPASKAAVVNIDRRSVSIEVKRALEALPGLQFRQGLVTDLRVIDNLAGRDTCLEDPRDSGERRAPTGFRVEVETIFGEVFQADAVVVAVGLSMGGRINAGSDEMPGGRYGEPDSEGLRAALERVGVEFRQNRLEVGPRVSSREAIGQAWPTDSDELVPLASGSTGADGIAGDWPIDYPPAVHRLPHFRTFKMLCDSGGGGEDSEESSPFPLLSPDGAAMNEVYVAPRPEGDEQTVGTSRPAADRQDEMVMTRIDHVIRGFTVTGLGDCGATANSAGTLPVWVVGRAAGAEDYVASLLSGVRGANDVYRRLRPQSDAAPVSTTGERGDRA